MALRSNLDECDDWYNQFEWDEDMNRDYFTKPIQTSRNMHDYGNMGKIVGMERESDHYEGMGVFMYSFGAMLFGGLVLALMFFAWIG